MSDDSANVDSSTVGFIQVLITGGTVGSILLLLFCILRTRVPDVFQLRQLLNTWKQCDDFNGLRVGVPYPRPTNSFFGWVTPVFSTSEDQVVRKVGLDAAIFLRFIRTCFFICACTSVYGLLVLMPAYGTSTNKNLPEDDPLFINGLRIVSLSNVPTGSSRFWATVLGEFVTAAIVIVFLALEYRHYADLRLKYRAAENPVNYSLIVFDIPADKRTEDAIRERFELLAPGQVSEVILVRNPSTALKLQGKLDAAVMKREVAEHVRNNKGKDPKTRPGMCGCLMCWKPSVDAQEHWASEQERLADEVHDQGRMAPATPTAIVTFSNKRSASLIVQANSASSSMAWRIERAPEPKAMHWGASTIPGYQAELRTIAIAFFMGLFTLFWTIPAGFIVGLFNLENLSKQPAFKWAVDIIDKSAFVRGLIQGLLPPVLMAVLISLIPTLFRFVVSHERIPSKSLIEVKTRDYFFMFTLYGSFLVIVVGSSLLQDIDNLKNINDTINIIASEVPGVGIYFASFVLVQALIPFPLALSGIVRIIVRWIMLKLAKTERQKRKARSGGSLFQYFRYFGAANLVLFLAMTYSTLSPLVTLCAVVYFGIAYVTYRYMLLNSTYAEWDGGGELFPGAYWGTMLGLVFKQVLVITILGLKKAPAAAAVTAAPTIITLCATFIISKRFDRIAAHGSLHDLLGNTSKLDELPARYRTVYEQPAGKVKNYENLSGVVELRDVYTDVEMDDREAIDAVQSETLDASTGYVLDQAANREDV